MSTYISEQHLHKHIHTCIRIRTYVRTYVHNTVRTFLQFSALVLDQDGVGHSWSSAVQHAVSEALGTVHVEHSAPGSHCARDTWRVHTVRINICTEMYVCTDILWILYNSPHICTEMFMWILYNGHANSPHFYMYVHTYIHLYHTYKYITLIVHKATIICSK